MRLPPTLTAAEAIARLTAEGWREIAQGDWSWVLASPDGARVARITPWDAAYKLHAENCIAHAGHRHLPRVDEVAPLAGEGYTVFMERLLPVEIGPAEAFCAALGFPRDTDKAQTTPDPADVAALAAAPGVASLRALLDALFARAASLPFFGGSDIRPGNLMCDEAGTIKVIDPIFVAGPQNPRRDRGGRRGRAPHDIARQSGGLLDHPSLRPQPECGGRNRSAARAPAFSILSPQRGRTRWPSPAAVTARSCATNPRRRNSKASAFAGSASRSPAGQATFSWS